MKVLFPYVGNSIGGSHKSSVILINELKKNYILPKIILHEKGMLSKFLDIKNINHNIKDLPYWMP